MTTLDASLPQSDRIQKYILASVGAHLLLLAFLTVRAAFFDSEAIEYEAAVRVDLVALPDKGAQVRDLPEAVEPEPVAAKEKETPPSNPPTPKTAEVKKEAEKDTINLEKTQKQKQQAALDKMKQMNALEQIEKQIESDNKNKAVARAQQIKGNVLSSGTELKGVAKLEHENYISLVERQIRQHWALPEWLAKKNLRAQIRVRFDDKGNVIDRDIVKSSGNPSFDEVVIAAVDQSSPLPAPPAKLARILSHEGILFGFPE